MASTSTPSSSSLNWKYEVFLSFRGADLRKTFVDHLYAALDRCGIYAFKDDIRLQGGESISHQLLKAIERSRSVIVVFSRNYSSSCWCLDELEKIMECKEKLKLGLTVFPVFYDVDPSEVRRQSGTFGEGFAKAVERKADKADVWRKALQDAADLSGYNVRNTADGHESQCIKHIVDWILSNSCNIIASSDENLIGIESRVSNLISLIRRDLDDVRMIGIRGMGGSGKTTVARVAFDEVSKHFDGVSFNESVREGSQKSGLPLLQKKVLSDILMDENQKVDSVSQGIQMIRRRLGHKKVLIVLDDVDDLEQLRALAGGHSWFGKGSRILITTRDEHVLKVHEVDEIHGVSLLTEDEAIQLFRRYAFKKCSPTEGYDELSLNVVRYAAGLPLTLKVLGSFLCDRGMAEWTSALKRLKRFPEEKTLEILKISFDSLKDSEKDIFLDIACFFKGWKRDEVVRILDGCGFYPDIGISVLLQKCLITFSDYGEFQMHDLIQEMGMEMVNQLHPKEPGKRNRLWRTEDISDVLQKNMGTDAIEAIVSGRPYPFLEEHTSDSKAFMSMKKLRLLHLRNIIRDTHFGGPGYLPNELQWLSWERYPHESLAKSFQAPKLVGLEMQGSSIVQLWKGKKILDKLKFLDLSWSRKLIRTPDFSGIPHLKELNLQGCTSLIEVHPSIGDLQWLVLLYLGWCGNLVDFPSNIQMKSLEILDFSHCRKFKRFPELRGNMDRLSLLRLEFTAIEGLPSSIANLTKLVSIDLWGCENLLDLPDTICTLKNLKCMDLRWCSKLRKLPENLGHIESLEELYVSRSGVHVWPSSIGHLKNLRHVSLAGCSKVLDQLYYCHEEDNYIMTEQQPNRHKLDHSCGKHCKKLPLLQSMLQDQGHAVNHRLNFSYTVGSVHRCKLKWFGQEEVMKGNRFVLKLPPNWQNKITGFALCVVFYERPFSRIKLGISLSEVGLQIPGLDADSAQSSSTAGLFSKLARSPAGLFSKLARSPAGLFSKLARSPVADRRYDDVWICYISLKMLQRSTESVMPVGWMDAATQLRLTFSKNFRIDDDDDDDRGIESCAARVVCMDEVENSEASTALSSSFTCSSSSLQQQHDPNFAAETTLPCSKVPGTANDITLILGTEYISGNLKSTYCGKTVGVFSVG